MRASILAVVAYAAIGTLLYFALTETLLVFSVNGDSIGLLIQEVADEGSALTQDEIFSYVALLGIDLANYQQEDAYSVITGAERLIERGDVVAGGAIILFSIVFPILKLLSGLINATFGGDTALQRVFVQFHRLSMLDVFVASVVVFVIGRSTGYAVELGHGFYIFLAYWIAQYGANLYFGAERRKGERPDDQGAVV